MPDPLHIRTVTPAVVAGDGRTVTIRVVSWDRDYRVSDDGRTFYTERFIAGGLNMRSGAELVATSEHDPRLLPEGVRPPATEIAGRAGTPVARIAATHVRSDGLYADVRVFESIDGDQLLEYIRSGRELAVSSEFVAAPQTGPVREYTDAELVGVAFTLTPQHADAGVVAVRSNTQPTEETIMDAETPAPAPQPVVSDDTSGQPAEQAPAVVRSTPEPDMRQAPRPGVPGVASGASHFRSLGHFAQAVARGELGDIGDERRQRFVRALDTGTTADTAGLIQDQWIPEVIDLYRTLTPTVQAFRQRTLPDTGMVLNQPTVSVRPVVNDVTTQLTDLGTGSASTVAEIGTATWAVKTFGGGQNTSLQTILRTEPSYLDELMRLYVREMALNINLDACTALYAASNDTHTTSLEYTTAAAFDTLLIDASAIFLDTMHRPAEVAMLSIDLWEALASAKDTNGDFPLYPAINPFNRQGRINAVDAQGNIAGIDWYVEPALGARGAGITGVVGVRDAWMTATSPMGTLSADVPSNISRDMAVYQFAAFGATDTAGLVQIVDAV